MYCAGSGGTHPWNTLIQDLQERVLLHLPLLDLGRAVCLGRAFRSAFKHRLLEAEEGLTRAAIAAYGKPLLAGVARVLRRHRHGVDLLSGRGAPRLSEEVLVDVRGTVTEGERLRGGGPGYHVRVRLHRQVYRGKVGGVRELSLFLHDGNACGPKLTLIVQPYDSSNPHRVSAALLEMHSSVPGEADTLSSRHLGAFLVIARLAGQGSTCQETLRASGHVPGATLVGPPFPGGGCPAQPLQGNPFIPLQSNSGAPTEAFRSLPHWSPMFQTARHVRVHRYACKRIAVLEGLDEGVATAVVLAAALQVPCCHVRLQPAAVHNMPCCDGCLPAPSGVPQVPCHHVREYFGWKVIGACRDPRCCCAGYPLSGVFMGRPDGISSLMLNPPSLNLLHPMLPPGCNLLDLL
jgi:hypothetical protein